MYFVMVSFLFGKGSSVCGPIPYTNHDDPTILLPPHITTHLCFVRLTFSEGKYNLMICVPRSFPSIIMMVLNSSALPISIITNALQSSCKEKSIALSSKHRIQLAPCH